MVSHYHRNVEQQHAKPAEHLAWGTRAKGDNLMAQITVGEVREKVDLVLADFYPELVEVPLSQG